MWTIKFSDLAISLRFQRCFATNAGDELTYEVYNAVITSFYLLNLKDNWKSIKNESSVTRTEF